MSDFVIFYSNNCQLHNIPSHIERPQRIESILTTLKKNFPLNFFQETTEIQEDKILLFHSLNHLNEFKSLCLESEEKKKICRIDGDTNICQYTRKAVYHSAGSIINAIDRLYLEQNNSLYIRSAFCCVRPPGHHATPDRSMGFCFFNNAGIGARYAQEQYGLERVAVLDFDVHHGNGTEDGFLNDSTLFYGSTHELGNYPGTGVQPSLKDINPTEFESLRQVINKDNIFNQLFDLSLDSLWSKSPQVPSLQVSRSNNLKYQRIVNRQIHSGQRSRYEFRLKWREILYEMIWFNPELVIISAGFDAHDEDPLADLELIEEDYAWATYAVCLACECCGKWRNKTETNKTETDNNNENKEKINNVNENEVAKCISILEGGYHLDAISNSSVEHVKVLYEYANKLSEISPTKNIIIEENNQDLKLNEVIDNIEKITIEENKAEQVQNQVQEQEQEQEIETNEKGEVVENEGDEDIVYDGPKKTIEEILASLDQSIGSILMEALMTLPTPILPEDENNFDSYEGYEGYEDYDADEEDINFNKESEIQETVENNEKVSGEND